MKSKQEIDKDIEEKLEIIRLIEIDMAQKAQTAEALSSIIVQRQMSIDILTDQARTHTAVVTMFRSRYGHEINTGQHDGKTVAHLVMKYLARERNLAQGLSWRCSLARFILGDTLDSLVRTHTAPRPKVSNIQGGDDE